MTQWGWGDDGRPTCLLWPELISPQIGLILASYVRAWSPGEEWVTERNWGGGCAWCPAQTPCACQLLHPYLGCPPTLPTAFWPGCPSGSRAHESSDAPPTIWGPETVAPRPRGLRQLRAQGARPHRPGKSGEASHVWGPEGCRLKRRVEFCCRGWGRAEAGGCRQGRGQDIREEGLWGAPGKPRVILRPQESHGRPTAP